MEIRRLSFAEIVLDLGTSVRGSVMHPMLRQKRNPVVMMPHVIWKLNFPGSMVLGPFLTPEEPQNSTSGTNSLGAYKM